MPTVDEIQSASSSLDDVAQAALLTLIRQSAHYDPGRYPDLAAQIAASDGTVVGQQLNAVLSKLDEVGDGTVAVSGGKDGADYSQARDREALVAYALSALYETPYAPPTVASGVMQPARTCPQCGRCFLASAVRCLGCGYFF